MKIYRCLPTIKALTFDLDDTLYDNHPVMHKLECEMVKWLHQHHPISANYTLDQWQTIKRELLKTWPELKHDVTLWRKTQIAEGLKQLGYSTAKAEQASQESMKEALRLRNQVDVPQESHDTLQALSQHFPLIAITNGNVDVHQIGLGGYFDLILKAGSDGRSKPCRDMFVTAANHLKLPYHQILHVGDHLISDVSGAKRRGFSACWINNTPEKSMLHATQGNTLPDLEIQHISELLLLL